MKIGVLHSVWHNKRMRKAEQRKAKKKKYQNAHSRNEGQMCKISQQKINSMILRHGVKPHIHQHTHIYTHRHIYIYIEYIQCMAVKTMMQKRAIYIIASMTWIQCCYVPYYMWYTYKMKCYHEKWTSFSICMGLCMKIQSADSLLPVKWQQK